MTNNFCIICWVLVNAGAYDDGPQLSYADSRHTGLTVLGLYKIRNFSHIVQIMDRYFLYVAVFYKDNFFNEKSTVILHLYRNISGLVNNINVRQYVSSILQID
jgi:hypothetical protein